MIDNEPAAPVGYRFGGVWTTTAFVGRGPVGEVYECTGADGQGPFAAKLLPEELLESSETWSSYLTAVSATGALPSEATVRHVAFGSDLQLACPFIVTERVALPSLAECVVKSGPLAPQQWGKAFAILATLIENAHAMGVSHGRLTPTNVFVSPSEPGKVKVTDFGLGIACAARPGDRWGGGVEGWAGPESEGAGKQPSPAGDVYSLGLLTFFALTGKTAFRALDSGTIDAQLLRRELGAPLQAASAHARQLGADLDPAFDKWFARAVVPSPAARYGSVRLMGEAFERLVRRMAASPAKPLSLALPSSAIQRPSVPRIVPKATSAKALGVRQTPAYGITSFSRQKPGAIAVARALEPRPSSPVAVEPGAKPELDTPSSRRLRARADSGVAFARPSVVRSPPLGEAEDHQPQTGAGNAVTAEPSDDQPTLRMSIETLLATKAETETPPIAPPEPIASEVATQREPAGAAAPVPPEPVAAALPRTLPEPVAAAPAALPEPVAAAIPEPPEAVAAVVAADPELPPVSAFGPARQDASEIRAGLAPQQPLLTRPKVAAVLALGLVLFGVVVGRSFGGGTPEPEVPSASLPTQVEATKCADPAAAPTTSPAAAKAPESKAAAAVAVATPAASVPPATPAASVPLAGTASAEPSPPAPPGEVITAPVAPAAVEEPATPNPSRVQLRCNPECDSLVCDGRLLKSSEIELPPGRHTCLAQKQGHVASSKTFEIVAGADVTHTFELAKAPPRTSAAKPRASSAPARKKPCGTFINPCK